MVAETLPKAGFVLVHQRNTPHPLGALPQIQKWDKKPCRSAVKVSVGKSRNDFQFHLRRTFVPSSITHSHWSSGMCGVGPADKTGKSVVRYCPGGSFASAALRRPEKPREIVPIYTSPSLIKVSDSFANPPFSMTNFAI